MTADLAEELRRLIDVDEAYDEDPLGEPPIRVHVYRAALRAALDTRAAEPQTGRWLTAGETIAYRVGGDETLDRVRLAVAEALDLSTRSG